MGNILSKIADDYNDYRELCEANKILPKDIIDDFYAHEKQVREASVNSEFTEAILPDGQ